MSPAAAPSGFLTLGDAALRVKDRLRCSGQKAEYKVVRAIMEGRVCMVIIPGLVRLVPAEGMEFEFATSLVVAPEAPDDRQVIHLTISGLGSPEHGGSQSSIQFEPPPIGTPIVLDEDDIDRLLDDELAPKAPAPAVTAPYQPPAWRGDTAVEAKKRPAHRPPIYDWQFYETQARRRVFQHGLPEKSSVLVREILDLFGRRDEGPPEQRTVERKIEEWWPGLQTLIEDLKSPCELIPEVTLRRN